MGVKPLVLDGNEGVDEHFGNLLILRPEPVFTAMKRDHRFLQSRIGIDIADGCVQAAVKFQIVQPVIVRVDVALDIQQERTADNHAGDHPDNEDGEKDIQQIGQRLDEHEQGDPKRIPQRAAGDAAGERQAALAGGSLLLGGLFLFPLRSLPGRPFAGVRRRRLFRRSGVSRSGGSVLCRFRRRRGVFRPLRFRLGRLFPRNIERLNRLEFVFVFPVILVHPDLPSRPTAQRR